MRRKQLQGGTTAIEFALIFPVLFFLMYSTVIYSLVYYVKQSINFAAQEAARAAVAVDLAQANAASAVTSAVSTSVNYTLSTLPSAFGTYSAVGTANTPTSGWVTVTVTLVPNAGLFSAVSMPGLGAIPPLPAAGSAFWQATAVGQL